MSELLAKDPAAFLSSIHGKLKGLNKLREQQQELEARPNSDVQAMNKLREVLRDIRKLAVEIVDLYEELDDWVAGGGDAPKQWIEEKPVF